MHAVAATAPRGNLSHTAYVQLFQSIGYTLPCPHCREHYLKFLQDHPLEPFLQDEGNHIAPAKYEGVSYGNIGLQRWVHTLHNEVNRRLSKPEFTFSDSLNLVHDSCSARVSPTALASPFYGYGTSKWLTDKQDERLFGGGTSDAVTASLTGSNVVNITVAAGLIVCIVVIAITLRRPPRRLVPHVKPSQSANAT